MSKTFYVILPSDTRDPPDNRTNKFTVRLPKTLRFQSLWLCGLSSIIYPHSFAAIGTTQEQYIYVMVADHRYDWPFSLLRINFPKGTYKTPQDLATRLNSTIEEAANALEAEWHRTPGYRPDIAARPKRAAVQEQEERDDREPAEVDDRDESKGGPSAGKKAKVQDKEPKSAAPAPAAAPAAAAPAAAAAATAAPDKDDREGAEVEEEDDVDEARRRDRWEYVHAVENTQGHRFEIYRDNKDRIVTPSYHGKMVRLSATAKKPSREEIRDKRLFVHKDTTPDGRSIEIYYNPKGDIVHMSLGRPAKQPQQQQPSEPPAASPKEATKDPEPEQPPKIAAETPVKPPEQPKEKETEPSAEVDDREVTEDPSSKPPTPPMWMPPPKVQPLDYLLGKQLKRFGNGTVDVESGGVVRLAKRDDEVNYATLYNMRTVDYLNLRHHHHHGLLRQLRFTYSEQAERFSIAAFGHGSLEYCYFSPQLAYALGYSEERDYTGGTEAEHPPDLGGGIHHLYVYASNLTENIVVGDKMAALLRIVTIKGSQGQMMEQTYDTPIMSRVVNNDVNEIGIEVRTADGRLFPFEWGTLHLVLVFKKAIYL